MDLKKLSDIINQLQGLIAAVVAIGTVLGIPRSPFEWTARQIGFVTGAALQIGFVTAVALVVIVFWIRQRRATASRLLNPDALRLDSKSPDHLMGRKADLTRIQTALGRSLVFLIGESGCGKSALLQAGIARDPAFVNQYLPIYIEMTDLDWEDGPLRAARDGLLRALPESEREGFPLEPRPNPIDLGEAFALYHGKLGRRPLLLLDQFDDYQARDPNRFQTPNTRIWRSTDEIVKENDFWRVLHTSLQETSISVLIAVRSDEADGLECVRLLPKPASLSLDRLERGYARQIIDTLTSRPADVKPVIARPDSGWTALRDHIADQLEARGAVLPQQLKMVLLGLVSLRRLTLGNYDRAGRLDGLEVGFVRDAVAAAAHRSGLGENAVLNLLLPLVDDRRQPPAKATPRTAGELSNEARTPPLAVLRALSALADREIVRARGEGEDPETLWQLDHDYLARPILRLNREHDRRQMLLKERAKAFRDAGASLRLRWNALLSLRQQVALLVAWLRRRLRYGEHAGFAFVSLLVSALTVALGVAVAGSIGWVGSEYDRAGRIEAKLGEMQQPLTKQAREALLDLSQGSSLLRWLVKRDLFRRPEDAARFNQAPDVVGRALVGLEPGRLDSLFQHYMTETTLGAQEPAMRLAGAHIATLGSSTSPSLETARAALAPVLDAMKEARDPNELSALAQAYQVVAGKLSDQEAQAKEALAPVLDAMKKAREPAALIALAQAYQAVAGKLPREQAKEALAPVLDAMKEARDPNELSALAQAYQAVAGKLPREQAKEALAPVLDAMKGRNSFELMPLAQAVAGKLPREQAKEALALVLHAMYSVRDPGALKALAQAYQAVTGKLSDQEAQAKEALALVLGHMNAANREYELHPLAGAYQAVAGKLPSEQAKEALAPVLAFMKETRDSGALSALAQAYQAVAGKLPREQAKEALAPVLDAMKEARDPNELSALAQAYQAITGKLSDQEAQAKKALALVLAFMSGARDLYAQRMYAKAYQAVAGKLPSEQAKEALAPVLDAMKEAGDSGALSALAQAYQAVAGKLPREQAKEALAPVLDAMKEARDPNELSALAQAYQAVAGKLPDQEAPTKKALAPVLAAMKETHNEFALGTLAGAYQAVAGKLPKEQAKEALAPVLAAMKGQVRDPYALGRLAEAYQAVAGKLPDQEAQAKEALAPVLDAMKEARDPKELSALAQAYQAVAGKLPREQAKEALAPVLDAMKEPREPAALSALAEAYQAIAGKLDNTALRQHTVELLDHVKNVRARDSFLQFSRAIMIGWRALSWQEAERLVAELLRDPLSAGRPTEDLLDEFAKVVGEKAPELKPKTPWGHDLWAFVAWTKSNPKGFDPDRSPPLR